MPARFWTEKTRRFRRWLAAEDDEAEAERPAVAPTSNADDRDKWYDGSEIESLSMEQILLEGVAAGRDKVYLIALDDFSGAVGDKWPRLKTKVDLITDNAARRHLERGCLFQNLGDGLYTVAVQADGGPAALAKVFAMAEDIGRRLVGDRFTGLKAAGVVVAQVEASRVLDAAGKFDPLAVNRLVRDSGAILAPLDPPPADERPAARMVALDHRPREHAEGRMVAMALPSGFGDVGATDTRQPGADTASDWRSGERGDEDWETASTAGRGDDDSAWFSGERQRNDPAFGVSGEREDRDIQWGGGGEAGRSASPVPIGDEAAAKDERWIAEGGGGAVDDPRWDSAESVGRSGRLMVDAARPAAEEIWLGAEGGAGREAGEWGAAERTGRGAPTMVAGDTAAAGTGPPPAAPFDGGGRAAPEWNAAEALQADADPAWRTIEAGAPPSVGAEGAPVALSGWSPLNPAAVQPPPSAARNGPDWREGEITVARTRGLSAAAASGDTPSSAAAAAAIWEKAAGTPRGAAIVPPDTAGMVAMRVAPAADPAVSPTGAGAEWTVAPVEPASGRPRSPPAVPKSEPEPGPAREWRDQKPPEGAVAPRLERIDHVPVEKPPVEWRDIAPMAPKAKAAAPDMLPRSNFAVVETVWRPCRMPPSGRVEAHLCLPILREGGKVRRGDALLPALGGKSERLDYEMLMAAVVALSRAGGRPLGTIVVALHYSTLHLDAEVARIRPALAALAGLPGVGRLLVEVGEVPPNAQSARLVKSLAPLRLAGTGLLLRRSLALPQWRVEAVGDLAGIGLDLAALKDWEREPGHLPEALRRFRAQTGPVPAYAWNVADGRELTAIAEARFTLAALSGPDLSLPGADA